MSSSFVPGAARSGAGRLGAACGPECGRAAISQAFLPAPALHEVVIKGLLVGDGVHEISCVPRKRPRAIATGFTEWLCFSSRLGRQVLTVPPASSRPMGKVGLIC